MSIFSYNVHENLFCLFNKRTWVLCLIGAQQLNTRLLCFSEPSESHVAFRVFTDKSGSLRTRRQLSSPQKAVVLQWQPWVATSLLAQSSGVRCFRTQHTYISCSLGAPHIQKNTHAQVHTRSFHTCISKMYSNSVVDRHTRLYIEHKCVMNFYWMWNVCVYLCEASCYLFMAT